MLSSIFGSAEEPHRGITAAITKHIRWQNKLLKQAATAQPRFLVLRPGDKLTLCDSGGMADVRAHCYKGKEPHRDRPDGTHWDAFILGSRRDISRPIPGMGNVALSLVSAAATAIVSRRVLLLENFSASGASFGSPLRELLVETSGWAPHLAAAGRGSHADGFAAHDDFSAFETMCGQDLRQAPAARVWRIFSNQYFLPLLLLNPHHARHLEALAEPLAGARRAGGGGGGGGGGDGRGVSLWTPALRALWTPTPRLAQRIAQFVDSAGLREPYVAMHIRVNIPDQRDGKFRFGQAVECVRARLAAANASRLFVATMFQKNRRAFAQALNSSGVSVHWFGRSVEAQAESSAASDSALADMLLMGGAREVLVSPGSTFGYVAQGLAGRRATIYGGTHTSRELVGHDTRHCSAIATSEPNFHFLKHALKKFGVCRAGAKEAHARSSEMYRLSSMQH